MADFSELSTKLQAATLAQADAMNSVVKGVQTLPDYQAYEKAVVTSERSGDNYMSMAHPASNMDAGSRQSQVQVEERQISSTKGRLQERLTANGIPAEQLAAVMDAVSDAAYAAAKGRGRAN